MITIWLAVLLMLVSGCLGVIAMGLCAIAGRADECNECERRRGK